MAVTKVVSLRLVLALVVFVVMATAAAGVARADAGVAAVASTPVTGTTSDGGTFTGTMDITGFAVQDGQVVALGTLSGTVTDADGNIVGMVSNEPVAAAVQQATSECTLFSITIGAIDINVAGLVTVHVDPIGVNVGLSGLLGTLLCGLLGGGVPAGGAPPLPAA